MKRRTVLSMAVAAGFLGSLPAVEEPFCDPAVQPDVCIESFLSIRFVETGTSEIHGVLPGQEVRAVVTIDVKDEGISGFSYGVKHDPTLLSIPQPAADDPTCDSAGTATGDFSGCNPTTTDTDWSGLGGEVGGWLTVGPCEGNSGFYSARIFSLRKMELPLGPGFSLARVTYRVLADPGPDGTKLSFTDELNPVGSPQVTVNLTQNGKSRRPRIVNNAMIYGSGETPHFFRTDANGDGKVGIADVIVIANNLFTAQFVFFDCPEMLDVDDDGILDLGDPIALAAYLFQAGPPPPPPFGSCGEDPTLDALGCSQPNCRW
jgi:hypothetical protein